MSPLSNPEEPESDGQLITDVLGGKRVLSRPLHELQPRFTLLLQKMPALDNWSDLPRELIQQIYGND